MVLTGMRLLEIPIHQMSVTGLIIALGLLIDNAIVTVDEVSERLRDGRGPAEAVSHTVRRLAVPLLGSTITTALAFAPIAIMPGPAGEFVGSIAVSVILAICSSFFLAMTVVPAATALLDRVSKGAGQGWWHRGVSHRTLTGLYRRSLDFIFRRPGWGVALGVVLPLFGFFQARHLAEQFFPPSERNQFQLELELPAAASLSRTLSKATTIRQRLLSDPAVERVDWFLGESAPTFYYNLLPRNAQISSYAQGLVTLKSAGGARDTIRRIQNQLDREFPDTRVLARQLEQGPPFTAPVEVRLYGPDLERLRELGDELRLHLSEVPEVIHTKADLSEPLPKLSISVDEESARLAGLDHTAIARQLDASLEGAVGGSVLEATEELPVRVRLSSAYRGDLAEIASLDLLSQAAPTANGSSLPLSALAEVKLAPEISVLPRFNGRRMNEVQGFITAGVLPAEVLEGLQQRLTETGFSLPPGYSMEYGGEAAKRDDAVGNLMASVGVLALMMVATLVLSLGSFRMAGIIGAVAFLSAGLSLGALWLFGHPFGFMAIVGTMGLIGVAINDAIVVLTAIRGDSRPRRRPGRRGGRGHAEHATRGGHHVDHDGGVPPAVVGWRRVLATVGGGHCRGRRRSHAAGPVLRPRRLRAAYVPRTLPHRDLATCGRTNPSAAAPVQVGRCFRGVRQLGNTDFGSPRDSRVSKTPEVFLTRLPEVDCQKSRFGSALQSAGRCGHIVEVRWPRD
jgi:multidrug efflux pump subunit AcrB